MPKKLNGDNLLNQSAIPKWLAKIPSQPKLFQIQSANFTPPIGGHLQGIQQLDSKHLVITGSSNDKAYFLYRRCQG